VALTLRLTARLDCPAGVEALAFLRWTRTIERRNL
jgi:hypothetical protein